MSSIMNLRLITLAVASVVALAACNANNDAAGTDTAAATPAPADTAPAAPVEPAAPAAPAAPASNPMVGGAAMDANMDIVDNASKSSDHTTLVSAVQAAGLVDTLKGAGPFTVFAPTNAAFQKLPAGTVDGLLKPEKKTDLSNLLTYHVVSGNVDAAALKQQITAGNGSATLTTVAGGTLTAKDDGMGGIVLTDAKGGTSKVTVADVRQKNGVVHVVDTVLMP